MIEEVGTVIELPGKQTARVLCKKSSLCENCASSGACSLGDDDRSRVVEVTNTLGAGIGDQVKIVTSTRMFLHSSFMLYIVPLIALVIGAVAGKLIGESMIDTIDPNLLSAILGLFFLVGSLLLIRVGTNALAKDLYRPRICEILSEET
ncbi:MAG: SoxR reducing system RseC family protein [Desulfuromonadales bacterium]|nr:SoxR reducing system RseC family protein [Desulfuromonadales bacterium]